MMRAIVLLVVDEMPCADNSKIW